MTYVFAPHPDDETLACGGTIRQKVLKGEDVKIVFMTDGSHSHSTVLGIEVDPSPEEVAAIREAEAQSAAGALGIPLKNLTFLRIEDGHLAERQDVVLLKLVQLLEEEENIAEVYIPHSRDKHKDHSATNSLVRKALQEAHKYPEIYQYIVWPASMSDEPTSGHVEVDIAAHLAAKNRAIDVYKSQIGLISPTQTRPVLQASFVDPFRHSPREAFWRLTE